MSTDPSALVLFSGGQDSATCLAWALDRFARVETVGFDYGQRHRVELAARPRLREAMAALSPVWAARLGPDHLIDLAGFGQVADSALTRDRAIEMDARGLPTTFVPGRNLVFLLYAAALGDRRGIDRLVGGMCETDFSGYPDCRRDTLDALQAAMTLGMERPFAVETPLMRLTKAETWGLAERLGGPELVRVIVEESRTCYLGDETPHAWGRGCATCPACELRARGWETWRGTAEAPAA
jgi:7-cyano-7-deazaguanine synthase